MKQKVLNNIARKLYFALRLCICPKYEHVNWKLKCTFPFKCKILKFKPTLERIILLFIRKC